MSLCVRSQEAKYMNRPGPPFPAQHCRGQIKYGNNGIDLYISATDKNGIHHWKKYSGSNPFKSRDETPRFIEAVPRNRSRRGTRTKRTTKGMVREERKREERKTSKRGQSKKRLTSKKRKISKKRRTSKK